MTLPMRPELAAALSASEYEALPAAVKATLSEREWRWLADGEKARLVQTETEPETWDD